MSLPYFREWVENWRSSPRVGEMDLEQRGAFHEMLCLSWQMGPVPNDPERLAMLIGVRPADFIRAWREPLTKCWRKTRKGLLNDRLERERAWAESRQKKARESAKHRVYRTSDDANAMRSQSARSANGSAQIALLSRSRTRSRSKDKKEKEKRKRATAPVVFWNPEPVWEENHPSHAEALLRVDDEHLKMLVRDYPAINVRDEIVNLKNKALAHTKKYGVTRNWQARLTNWLKNAVVFEAERNCTSRAARPQSPATEELATEEAWEAARPDNAAEIAACEKEHGPHAGRLTKRERYAFCDKGCGYREMRDG